MTEAAQKTPGVVATHGMVTEWVGKTGPQSEWNYRGCPMVTSAS